MKVPELVERVVEKIVYLEKKTESAQVDKLAVLNRLFEDILTSE